MIGCLCPYKVCVCAHVFIFIDWMTNNYNLTLLTYKLGVVCVRGLFGNA